MVGLEDMRHSNFTDVVFPYKLERGLVDFLVDILIELGDGVFPPYLMDLSSGFPSNEGEELDVLLLLENVVFDVIIGEAEAV